MAEHVQLVPVDSVKPNPENPRLIFHQDELDALQDSIKQQGILVPLTIYRDSSGYRILDGERRWRCAKKLGIPKIPAIVQPKPSPLQNIMMMFAIHHRRNEWDPLPTALKLQSLEDLYARVHRVRPTEKTLAELASLTRGEVRRYKKLLALPEEYKSRLMEELSKPRSQQTLTVDHVLEATAAAQAMRKRQILDEVEEEQLRRAIVGKFSSGSIDSTVDPRKFSKLARAVEREEVSREAARRVTRRFIADEQYSIRQLFSDTVEEADFQHGAELMVERLIERLQQIKTREYDVSQSLAEKLQALRRQISRLLG